MTRPDDAQRSSLREGEVTPPRKTLADILDGLPASPGVYIMKGRARQTDLHRQGGGAAQPRAAVLPAGERDSRDFVPLLDGIVADIETVITSNEKEALLLENTLIKRHQPRFNVNLKDDKNYLVLKLDPKGEWPRLEVVRKLGDDGAYYFGPYHSATSCREALRVVNRHFQLRTCTDHVLHNRRRPCLQYQIKRCPAPCVLPVPREAYGEQVRDVRLFLDGKSDELLDRLRARMKDGGGAHRVRARGDDARSGARAGGDAGGAAVVSSDFVDQDVFGFHREGLALEIVVMSIRGGKLGTAARSRSRARSSRRRAAVVVHRPVLRPGAVAARRGAAAHRHRGRGAEGGVAVRSGGRRTAVARRRSRSSFRSGAIAAS
jgi:excinuclease ABC subunit C